MKIPEQPEISSCNDAELRLQAVESNRVRSKVKRGMLFVKSIGLEARPRFSDARLLLSL